jgi:hypothetical protein
MRTTSSFTFMLGLTALLLSSEALAFRCGSKIITKGDTQGKVSKYCGEPVTTTRSFGIRHGTYLDGDAYSGRYIGYGNREVVVENWILNLGPRKLMRKITFEDGIVVRIEELDYGYND